jgi:F-type H+-transporting ATPase subunit a
MRFLLDSSPVSTTHPAVQFCSSFFCKVDYDTLISSALAVIVTVGLSFYVARRLQTRRPGKLQMVFEFLLGYIKDLVRDNVGAEAANDLNPVAIPIAMTIFFYILVANWLDFFPLAKPFVPAMSDLNQTLAMAIVVFLVVQWYSFKSLGFRGFFSKYLRLAKMMPWWMQYPVFPLWVFLSLLEDLIKPVTLSLRLFGNIFAGVVMVELLGAFFQIGSGVIAHGVFGTLGVMMLVAWKAFDVFLIGAIQAFIFMLLTIIYFGMAREGLEEEGHGAQHAEAA